MKWFNELRCRIFGHNWRGVGVFGTKDCPCYFKCICCGADSRKEVKKCC